MSWEKDGMTKMEGDKLCPIAGKCILYTIPPVEECESNVLAASKTH